MGRRGLGNGGQVRFEYIKTVADWLHARIVIADWLHARIVIADWLHARIVIADWLQAHIVIANLIECVNASYVCVRKTILFLRKRNSWRNISCEALQSKLFLCRCLTKGMEIERLRVPKFYHYFHSKQGMWGSYGFEDNVSGSIGDTIIEDELVPVYDDDEDSAIGYSYNQPLMPEY